MKGDILYGDEWMFFNEKGEIGRKDRNTLVITVNPSPSWRMIGAVRYNNFGHIVEKIGFKDFKKLEGEWSYNNGKQKWHVMDFDHGTRRIWQSPNHHVSIEN